MNRLWYSAGIALLVTAICGLFVGTCGNLHGSSCGAPLTLLAYLLTLPMLAVVTVVQLMQPHDMSEAEAWIIFLIATFPVAFALMHFIMTIFRKTVRRRVHS